MFHLYPPLKRQKTFGFLTFSEGVEKENWTKMGYTHSHVMTIKSRTTISETRNGLY